MPMVERMSLAAAVFCAGLWLVGTPSEARALCSAPAFESLWTFPAHGQRGVPTNAQLWMKARGALPRQATLNGEPLALEMLSRFSAVRAVTPELEPGTAYHLVVQYEGYARTGDTELQMFEVVVDFETGGGPVLDAPSEPVVRGHELTAGWPADHACATLIAAQDCFDTGQDTLVSFDVEVAPTVVGWLYGGRVAVGLAGGSNAWALACGKPALYLRGELPCVDFHAIGPAGQVGRATTYCPEMSADPELGPSCYEVIELVSEPPGWGERATHCDAEGDDSLPAEPPVDAGAPVGGEDAAIEAGIDEAEPSPDLGAGADAEVNPPTEPQGGQGTEPEGAGTDEPNLGMQNGPAARDEPSSSQSVSSCAVSTTAQDSNIRSSAWFLLTSVTLTLRGWRRQHRQMRKRS